MSSALPGPQLAEVLTVLPDAEMRQAGLSRPAWHEAAVTCTELPPFFIRDTAEISTSLPPQRAVRVERQNYFLWKYVWKSVQPNVALIFAFTSLYWTMFSQPLSEPLWRTDLVTTLQCRAHNNSHVREGCTLMMLPCPGIVQQTLWALAHFLRVVEIHHISLPT